MKPLFLALLILFNQVSVAQSLLIPDQSFPREFSLLVETYQRELLARNFKEDLDKFQSRLRLLDQQRELFTDKNSFFTFTKLLIYKTLLDFSEQKKFPQRDLFDKFTAQHLSKVTSSCKDLVKESFPWLVCLQLTQDVSASVQAPSPLALFRSQRSLYLAITSLGPDERNFFFLDFSKHFMISYFKLIDQNLTLSGQELKNLELSNSKSPLKHFELRQK